MDLKEIQELIKFVSRSGVSEVELESKGFRLVVRTGKKGPEQVYVAAPAPAPVMMAAPAAQQPQAQMAAPAAAPAPVAAPAVKGVEQRSPMIGTFYRSPSPDKPVFVNVGDEVRKGQTLCIIEAMKLFNEIECEHDGRLVKMLVDDSSPVEYDQPLFLIEPN